MPVISIDEVVCCVCVCVCVCVLCVCVVCAGRVRGRLRHPPEADVRRSEVLRCVCARVCVRMCVIVPFDSLMMRASFVFVQSSRRGTLSSHPQRSWPCFSGWRRWRRARSARAWRHCTTMTPSQVRRGHHYAPTNMYTHPERDLACTRVRTCM
jgi:hypothetical protein